jgi:hypothetical protein
MSKLREIIAGAGPARYPHLEAFALGALGLSFWILRTALFVVLGGGPM